VAVLIVNSLHVENLLTFGAFDLQYDGASLVVVGPNGAGKSNIVRVVDLVQKAADSVRGGQAPGLLNQAAGQVLQSFAGARHHGEPSGRDAVVRLSVSFTTPAERAQLATFFRAAVLGALLQEISSGDDGTRLDLARWVEDEIGDERLHALWSGVFVLRHSGMAHVPWEISYEFEYDGNNYAWLLAGPNMMVGIIRADSPTARLGNVPRQPLMECLLGISRTGSPVQVPSPLAAFDFSRLCPALEAAVTAPAIQMGGGVFDQRLTPFRRASELLDISDAVGHRVIPLGYVLSRLLNDAVIVIGEQLRGLGTGGTPPQQPGPYPWEALASPWRSRASWQLPLRLFELKNGTSAQRERFKAVQVAFTALAPGRTFDIRFQVTALAPLTPMPVEAGHVAILGATPTGEQPDQGRPAASVTVVIDRAANGGTHPDDLPVQMHGAGTWEALVIAEALAESRDRFVILDEPAVTLHPTWQRALRSHIKEAPGQFLVITHSADLVPMEDAADLSRLVRAENETGQTRAHRFDASSLPGNELSRITREFALSVDAVSLLFARGVVLVEGETELGALPVWFRDCSARMGCKSPGELDLGFWSVGGDRNFQTYVAALNALAIPWVLICDGAVFDVEKRQASNPHIFDQVLKAGVDAPALRRFLDRLANGERKRVMNKRMFTDQRKLGAAYGIFTFAVGWRTANRTAGISNDESFEAFIDAAAPGMLDQARAEVGESKVRRGRWLGANAPWPKQVGDLYKQLARALHQRGLKS
jgi:energy-coupling factor transporter ATP-binding protein EcfA2